MLRSMSILSLQWFHCLMETSIGWARTIIRNLASHKLWGAIGPMNDQTEVQALLWGLQSALVHLDKVCIDNIHMETMNRVVFDNIRLREHINFPDDLRGVINQFDALYICELL